MSDIKLRQAIHQAELLKTLIDGVKKGRRRRARDDLDKAWQHVNQASALLSLLRRSNP